MYTRHAYATAPPAGVSCLSYSGAQHLALLFSRLLLLKLSEGLISQRWTIQISVNVTGAIAARGDRMRSTVFVLNCVIRVARM